MAGSLREIKAKIASIKQTSHITGAMQMVSASTENENLLDAILRNARCV